MEARYLPETEGEPENDNTTEPVDISVTVTDTNENRLENVEVTITDTTDSNSSFTGTTGSQGGCNLTNVPIGEYSVSAVKTGYVTYTGSLTVTSETDSLSIEMTEE